MGSEESERRVHSTTISDKSAFYVLKPMGDALKRGPIVIGESHGSAPEGSNRLLDSQ
jgi:hypothetical protein